MYNFSRRIAWFCGMIFCVRAYVGVTDAGWYRYLAARPDVTEVNFWRPNDLHRFGALVVGEPFFFKTHKPHDRVVGGGFYSGFARLRVSEAWACLGEGNGSGSLDDMYASIRRYRQASTDREVDPEVGCIFIRDVTFFNPTETADAPPLFAPNLVQGRSYDTDDHTVHSYFEELLVRLLAAPLSSEVDMTWHRPGPVYGDPRLQRQRLGQQAFEGVVLDAYSRRCAVTGDKIVPVLQAAHIRPLPAGGEHRLDNGLLLRSDVHTLFDRGYLGVDPKHRLVVSPRLRGEFGNGEEFYAREGEPIAVPGRRAERPNREFLEWHMDSVFLAS